MGAGTTYKEKTAAAVNSDGLGGNGNTIPAEHEFVKAMQDAGIPYSGAAIADGERHRVHLDGDKAGSKNGWYILFPDPPVSGAAGSWKTQAQLKWTEGRKGGTLSQEEHRALQKRVEAAKAERAAQDENRQQAAAKEAASLWDDAEPAPLEHPYLMRKGVQAHGLRQDGDALLIPGRDADGNIRTLQRIFPDGGKRFLPGGKVKGSHYLIGDPAHGRLYVAEGFATAATVHDLTGTATAVAFDCGNMKAVCEALRNKYPDSVIIVCCDNDTTTEGNPGQTKGKEAAAAVDGRYVLPVFTEGTGSDFNDLLSTEGRAAVMRCLLDEQTPDKRTVTSRENGQRGGREKTPYSELATEFAGTQRDAQGRLLLRFWMGGWWMYRGGCYRAVQANDARAMVMDFLRTSHPRNASKTTTDNIMANCQSFGLCGIPSHVTVPAWLDSNNTDAAGWLAFSNMLVNVSNLARYIGGETIEESDIFRETTPDLFSTFGLDYPHDHTATCPKWLAYLEGVQPVEADREVLQMLAGLALIPETRYNVAFVLFGEAGTGKSVYLHVLQHLVGLENVCSLPLSQFAARFSSHLLTTHLLNIVGDLPTEDGEGHSLRSVEGMLKDVCDGGLIPVERKHQEPGKAPAIARNVFATNSLPRFADRSGAIWDRLRIIPFEQRFRGTGNENRNLRFEIVEGELPGVFNWAAQGLAKLFSQRTFPEHSGGLAAKEHHRRMCDPERVFLEEHYQKGGADDYVESKNMYGSFKEWLQDNGFSKRNEATFSEAVHRVLGVVKERTRIGGTKRVIFPRIKERI